MSQKYKNRAARLQHRVDRLEQEAAAAWEETRQWMARAGSATKELIDLQKRTVATLDVWRQPMEPGTVRCVLDVSRYELERVRGGSDLTANISRSLVRQLQEFKP